MVILHQFYYQTYRHAKLMIKDRTCGPAFSRFSLVLKYYFKSFFLVLIYLLVCKFCPSLIVF